MCYLRRCKTSLGSDNSNPILYSEIAIVVLSAVPDEFSPVCFPQPNHKNCSNRCSQPNEIEHKKQPFKLDKRMLDGAGKKDCTMRRSIPGDSGAFLRMLVIIDVAIDVIDLPNRDSNPGPLASKASIVPLDC